MKWLTAFLCLLAFQATAQEIPIMPQAEAPETQVFPLPFMLQCTPVAPDQMLEQEYSEIGFLEGDASIFNPNMAPVGGKFRMFMNPEKPRTYTIMIELGQGLHCMVMSGSNVSPMVKGSGI